MDITQTRGDAVGVHACIGISKFEAMVIIRLLTKDYKAERKKVGLNMINKSPMPLDFKIDKKGCLHYEAVLQALLLEGFADGKHRKYLGL